MNADLLTLHCAEKIKIYFENGKLFLFSPNKSINYYYYYFILLIVARRSIPIFIHINKYNSFGGLWH